MKSSQELGLLLFQALNSRDFTEVVQYTTEDVKLDFPGVDQILGQKRVVIFLKALLRKYPILIFNVHEILVDGELICVRWTNKGENLAGGDYTNSGLTLIHLDGGKISFISDYFKDTSFVQ